VQEQSFAVRRPIHEGTTGGVERHLCRRATFDRHRVRLGCSVAVADKGDLLAVWRELRLAIAGRMLRQLPGNAPARRHRPDVAVPIEGECVPVRRQGGVIRELDRLGEDSGGGSEE
jgi:hypothetical protein